MLWVRSIVFWIVGTRYASTFSLVAWPLYRISKLSSAGFAGEELTWKSKLFLWILEKRSVSYREGNPRVLQDQEIVTRNILAITWAPPIGRFMPVIDSPRRRKPMSCNAQFRIFPLQLPAEVPLTIWGRGKTVERGYPIEKKGKKCRKILARHKIITVEGYC